MVGVDLLSSASASTLVYRALSDQPDAVVIATEDFGTIAWQNDIDLMDVLSSTPTILLIGRIHAVRGSGIRAHCPWMSLSRCFREATHGASWLTIG